MKQKNKYIAIFSMALFLRIPSASAQFNTINEYGGYSDNGNSIYRHKKSCQPTTDSLLVDSVKTDYTKASVQIIDYSKVLALPLKNIHITSSFGRRIHPITKKHSLHNGIDLRASYEEVYSMLPGTVHRTGEDRRSGKYIIISTGDYKISYCHLSKINVRQGDLVLAGMPIGLSGNSGYSTGPHLHLTVRIDGKLHNPEALIRSVKLLQNTY